MKNDKIKHIAAGLLTVFVGIPTYQLTFDETTATYHLAAALWSTIVSGILLAGCKEFADNKQDGNKFDWLDFAATCLGAVIVALFIVAVHFAKG